MDRGPSVIHATDLAGGDRRQGPGHQDRRRRHRRRRDAARSSNPAGFSYPPGFPKGDTKLTTPKVIVAQRLPRPGRGTRTARSRSTRRSRTARTSPASRRATRARTRRPGPTIPPSPNLSGVAPKAWIGNYRVFTVPTPLGHEADTPEIVHAFEAAVADGMNVINFSGGGPQTDPANDAMYETDAQRRARRRRAGDRGRQRPRGLRPRHRRLAGHRARRDLGRRGLELARLRAGAVRHRRPAVARRRADPERRRREAARRVGDARPDDRRRRARSSAPTASPSTRTSAAPPTDPNCGLGTLPDGLADAARSRSSRAASARSSRRRSARQLAGAIGLILVDNRFGEANAIPMPLADPGRDDLRPRRRSSCARYRLAARRPGDDPRLDATSARSRPDRSGVDHELLVRRPDRLRRTC